jgi:alkanesulfonate monooxygenase SsuD/methylene tetrahydromethanopterin reductase-like flavin-dependent oxidoreductase (luciferase family)
LYAVRHLRAEFRRLRRPHNLLTLAREAEDAGWDGFFIWDHLLLYRHSDIPFVDAWVALGAIAAHTERLRLGP